MKGVIQFVFTLSFLSFNLWKRTLLEKSTKNSLSNINNGTMERTSQRLILVSGKTKTLCTVMDQSTWILLSLFGHLMFAGLHNHSFARTSKKWFRTLVCLGTISTAQNVFHFPCFRSLAWLTSLVQFHAGFNDCFAAVCRCFDNHFNRFSILSLVIYLRWMCSFNHSSNQAMAKKFSTGAQAVYSKKKWMKSTVKGKTLSYFFITQVSPKLLIL